MKAALSAVASAAVSGGTSRVLTSPWRGALAMIAIAQVSDRPAPDRSGTVTARRPGGGSRRGRRRRRPPARPRRRPPRPFRSRRWSRPFDWSRARDREPVCLAPGRRHRAPPPPFPPPGCRAPGLPRSPPRFRGTARRSSRSRPGNRRSGIAQRVHRVGDEFRVGVGEVAGRQIMIAGALVAQRAVDHDEIGRLAERRDLAGRGHADEKTAPRREQLLGDQHGKSGADGAADDTEAHRRVLELEQFGVVASPAGRRLSPARAAQGAHDVPVGVEQADFRHVGQRQVLSVAAPRATDWPARTPKRRRNPCRRGSAAGMSDRGPGSCPVCPNRRRSRQAAAQSPHQPGADEDHKGLVLLVVTSTQIPPGGVSRSVV